MTESTSPIPLNRRVFLLGAAALGTAAALPLSATSAEAAPVPAPVYPAGLLPIQETMVQPRWETGLHLIVGSTGTGKSTLSRDLAATRHLVKEWPRIIILQDDKELPVPYVSHLRVGENADATLQASLRWCPDMILLEEDAMSGISAKTLLRAAESGHCVVALLHGNSHFEGIQVLLNSAWSDPLVRHMSAGAVRSVTLLEHGRTGTGHTLLGSTLRPDATLLNLVMADRVADTYAHAEEALGGMPPRFAWAPVAWAPTA